MHRTSFAGLAAFALFAALTQAAPLIPRSDFFASDRIGGVAISPDGKNLCYAAPLNGVENIFEAPVANPKAAKPLSHTKRGIWGCFWSRDSRYVLYFEDETGAENNQLHAVDATTGANRDLTNAPKAQARLIADSRTYTHELLISLNDRDPQWQDVYRINLDTGERKLVYRNASYASFVAGDDLRLHYAVAPAEDGGNRVVRFADDGTASPYLTIPYEDALTTELIGLDRAGDTLYAVTSIGRERAELVSLDPKTAKETLLGSDAHSDITWPITIAPATGRMEAYSANSLKPEWKVIDPAVAADYSTITAQLPGRWEVSSRSADNRIWVISHDPIAASPRVLVYDRSTKTLKELFVRIPQLAGKRLAPMRGLTFKARDGLEIPAFLTLPVDADRNDDGKPDAGPLPMVILVHGGPWAHDDFAYNAEHQWLANRGYAVLSVNYRGSTGFGKAFVNAGNRQWGLAMEDDLIDAKRWAVTTGIARADKVAIRGFSYGGYSVLAALSMHPDEFACGVDQSGPADLPTLLESVPAFLHSLHDMLIKRVGDWQSAEGRVALKKVSPLSVADKIARPLLIGQGGNDPRVPKAQADMIVDAMQRNGQPVVYLFYPDEGHGLERPKNFMSLEAVTEAFLATSLGGTYQPIGDDLKGASLIVKTGGEKVPGLEAAVKAAAPSK